MDYWKRAQRSRLYDVLETRKDIKDNVHPDQDPRSKLLNSSTNKAISVEFESWTHVTGTTQSHPTYALVEVSHQATHRTFSVPDEINCHCFFINAAHDLDRKQNATLLPPNLHKSQQKHRSKRLPKEYSLFTTSEQIRNKPKFMCGGLLQATKPEITALSHIVVRDLIRRNSKEHCNKLRFLAVPGNARRQYYRVARYS